MSIDTTKMIKKLKIIDWIWAKNLLWNEWNLWSKESWAPKNLCSWIYFIEILEKTEQLIAYKEKWKLIWFWWYANYKSKKLKKRIFWIIKKILYKSPRIKDKQALIDYHKNYTYVPKSLNSYFDGEAIILIVDPEYRWKGIGKKLLIKMFELAKKDKIHHLLIMSDQSCNYHIYESLWCEKLYEAKILNEESDKLWKEEYEYWYVYDKAL